MKVIQGLAFSMLIGLSFLNAGSYTVDVSHSDVGFKVKHMMISKVKGNFEKFKGTFTINEEAKTFSSIDGRVDISSLTTQESKRDNHLKSKDFFNAEKYPQMHLQLIKLHGNKGAFELTIKDITKIVVLDIDEISESVKDPWGNTRLAFELHGKINRKDFNMNFHEVLETGGLLVDDTVKFDILLEGIKTK